MRVAIVHYWLVGMRGGEKVLESLCRRYPQADIFTHCVAPEALSPLLRGHRITTSFINALPMSRKWYPYYLPLMPLALEQLDLRGYDLVISSESGPAKGVIVPTGTPHLCYCHTPMRYLWDLYQEYLQEKSPCLRPVMRLLMHSLRSWDVLSANRVDRFVANSATVAARITRWWGRAADVVHPPVVLPAQPAAPRENTAQMPYLFFGQHVAYKRADLAIRACHRLKRPLVIAGVGPETDRLKALAASLPQADVTFTGRRQSQAEVYDLYAHSRALLFPGEEDFGIVPVEAMAAGCPVIAYGRGGATESVIDGVCGLLFAEQTEQALVDAMMRFEGMDFDAAAMRARAEMFSEARFMQEMDAQVALVMRGSRSPFC